MIADINDDLTEEKSPTTNLILEGNKDHLETKKQIESLRKQYGDGWLHSRGATMVHDVLGMEQETIAKSVSCEQMIQSMLEETCAALPKTVDCATSTPNKLSQDASFSDVPSTVEVSKTLGHFMVKTIRWISRRQQTMQAPMRVRTAPVRTLALPNNQPSTNQPS